MKTYGMEFGRERFEYRSLVRKKKVWFNCITAASDFLLLPPDECLAEFSNLHRRNNYPGHRMQMIVDTM